MQMSLRSSDNVVIQFGFNLGALDDTVIVDLSENDASQLVQMSAQPNSGIVYTNGLFHLTPLPPPTPPPAPPDIAALITALTASPSIDQPTKDKLISALKGN